MTTEKEPMSADAIFSQRAAARLVKLLDHLGYPFDLLGRSTAIGQKLGITMQAGQQLLSGVVPWTWEQLHSVCTFFEKEPGFFLDEEFLDKVPVDTQAVPSSDGGKTIAFSPPPGFLARALEPGARLRYLRERSDASPFSQGTLLIYAQQTCQAGDVRPGDSYVIDRGDYLEVMRCQSANESIASFESPGDRGVALMIPFEARDNASAARIAGIVIAAISAQ